MKGIFVKHGGVFAPYDDETYERFRKIKEGKGVELEFKQKRNIDLHRKFFSLINTAWSYLTEEQERIYGSTEGLRKSVTIAAGFYEPIMDFQEQRFVKAPKSISFSEMEEDEFEEFYERVKDVLFTYVLQHVSMEEFMSNLYDY